MGRHSMGQATAKPKFWMVRFQNGDTLAGSSANALRRRRRSGDVRVSSGNGGRGGKEAVRGDNPEVAGSRRADAPEEALNQREQTKRALQPDAPPDETPRGTRA